MACKFKGSMYILLSDMHCQTVLHKDCSTWHLHQQSTPLTHTWYFHLCQYYRWPIISFLLFLVIKSCMTLFRPTGCRLPVLCPWDFPGSSVHGISKARILEWAAIFSSRRSSEPRDQIHVSCTAGRFFTTQSPGNDIIAVLICILWLVRVIKGYSLTFWTCWFDWFKFLKFLVLQFSQWARTTLAAGRIKWVNTY